MQIGEPLEPGNRENVAQHFSGTGVGEDAQFPIIGIAQVRTRRPRTGREGHAGDRGARPAPRDIVRGFPSDLSRFFERASLFGVHAGLSRSSIAGRNTSTDPDRDIMQKRAPRTRPAHTWNNRMARVRVRFITRSSFYERVELRRCSLRSGGGDAREHHTKRGPVAGRAVRADCGVVRFGDPARDGQAEARATHTPRPRFVGTEEAFEDVRQIVRGDPNALYL